jgi:hypothetical protein
MDGLSVQKMGFTVTNSDVYGAGGTGRVTVFRFRYSPKDKTWVLSRVSRGDWGPPPITLVSASPADNPLLSQKEP